MTESAAGSRDDAPEPIDPGDPIEAVEPIDASAGGAFRRSIRHPIAAAHAFRALPPHKQAQAALAATGVLPRSVGRAAWRLADTLAAMRLRGRRDRPIAAPVSVMARSMLGQRDDAVRLAIEAAGSGPDRTAVRIAAVALALGFPTTAAAALEGRTLSSHVSIRIAISRRI